MLLLSPAPGRTSQWSAMPSATPDTRANAMITSAVVATSKKAPSGPWWFNSQLTASVRFHMALPSCNACGRVRHIIEVYRFFLPSLLLPGVIERNSRGTDYSIAKTTPLYYGNRSRKTHNQNTYSYTTILYTHSDRQRCRVETAESSVRLLKVFKCRQRFLQQRFHVPVAVIVFYALERQYRHAQRICK